MDSVGVRELRQNLSVYLVRVAAGESLEGNYQFQSAAGATGTKDAVASANADTGNAHVVALRKAP